jgi:hypothetical protein
VSETVRLIPLLCPKCQTPVPAQPDEVAWVCEQCRAGMLLSEEKGALPLEVFFSAGIPQNGTGLPFWVARGIVKPLSRKTYRGDNSRDMNEYWAKPRLFYVPAYACKLDDMLAAGTKLLSEPITMQPGSPTRFQPVTLPPEGCKPVAEFIVMSVEAARGDSLKELLMDVELDPPQLWILP